MQVGGIKPGCFKIGNTGGMLDNIIASKLYRPGRYVIVYIKESHWVHYIYAGMNTLSNRCWCKLERGIIQKWKLMLGAGKESALCVT